MKRRLLYALLTAFAFVLSTTAQTIVLSESFESGIPAAWTQENVVGDQLWTVESGNALQYPADVVAGAGTGRAVLRNTSGESKGYKTRLITPQMRLDTVFQPIVRYYHAQPKWTGDYDTLRVYFRTAPTANWVLLQEFTKPIQTWTKETIDLPRPTATYQLCFEGSENMGRGIVLDSIVVRSKPECTIPHDMYVSNMSEDATTLYWQASFDAVNFQIVLAKTKEVFDLDTVDLAAAKASGLIVKDTLVGAFPFYTQLTGLAPNTNYVAYVRSICEMENSDWGNLAFYKKAIKPAPYYENFNMKASSEVGHLADWTYGNSLMNDNPFINRHLSESAAKLYVREGTSLCFTGNASVGKNANIAAGEYVYAVTPEMNVPSLQEYQVRFWGTLGDYGVYRTMARAIIVGVMDDPEDISTFMPVDTMFLWKYATFEEHITSFASYTGDGKCVAFLSRFDQPNQFYIDDMLIEKIPAVNKVMKLKTIPTVTGVELSWENVGTNSYAVVVSATNTSRVDTLSAAERIVDVAATATAYTLKEGLTEGTTYYAYVKAEGGEWSNAAAFTTSFEKTLPMTFGFEKAEPVNYQWFTTCDKKYTITTSTSYKHTGSQALTFSMEQGRDAWLVFPMLDTVATGVELEFWMRAYSSRKNTQVTVGVMDDPADLTSFVGVSSFANATSTYKKYYTDFLPYTGIGRYIAIRWTETGETGTSYPILDDITIKRLGECIMPRVTVEDVTTETATLRWEAREMNKFQVLIDSVNTRDNAALGTAFTGKNAPYTTTVDNANTLTIPTGVLRWGRTYYAYVRSVNSDGSLQSVWSTPVEFTLGVPSPIMLPYTENFDYWGTGTGHMAAGWDVVSITAYPQVITSAKYKGYAGVQLKADLEGRTGKLYAPVLGTDDLSKVKISFYAKKGDDQSGTDSLFIGVTSVADTTAAITWLNTELVDKVNGSKVWIKYETVLNDWKPTMGNRIVFAMIQKSTSRNLYLDDITFESIQNITPFGFETKDVSDNNAVITWQGESEKGWNIVVTTDEVDPSDLSKVGADKIIIKDSVITENPITITKLQPQSAYYIYLKPVEGTTWSEGYYFFTACQKLSTATYFKMDFEGFLPTNQAITSYATSTFPECWTRHTAIETETDKIPYIYTVKSDEKTPKEQVYNGLASAKLYGSKTSAPSWFATPEIEALNMANVSVSCWVRAKKSSAPFGFLLIGVMKNPDDWSTFTKLYTYQPESNTDWVQVECDLGANGYRADMGNYIVFATPEDGTESQFRIDDIEIYESTCRKPHPVFSRPTDTSIRLVYANEPLNVRMLLSEDKSISSDSLNDANNTNYLPDLLASDALVKDTLIENKMGLVIDHLKSDYTYYVALQSQCDEDVKSQWVVTSFNTLCAPQTVSEIGLVDFEKLTGTTNANGDAKAQNIPCWTIGNKNSKDVRFVPYVGQHAAAPAGKQFLRFRTDPNSAGNGGYAIMPAVDIDDITKLQVSFLGRALDAYSFTTTYAKLKSSAGGIIVGVVTDPTDMSTFVGVDTIYVTDNNVYQMMVRFNNYKGDANGNYGKHIAFLSEFSKINFFLVDNVLVEPIPDCALPLSLKVDSLSDITADISWNGVNDSYRVMVTSTELTTDQLEGYTDYVLNDTVQETSYKAVGLTGAKTYYVYVKALCGDTKGEWGLRGISFITDCPEVLILPYKEDFDRYASVATKNPPVCWQTFYNGLTNTEASYPTVVNTAGQIGNGLSWNCPSTYKDAAKRPTAVTLPIGGNISEATISFDYRCSVATAASPSAFLLGLATDVSCLDSLLATVQYIDTIYPPAKSNVWQEYSRNMEDCKGENLHIVLSQYYVASTGNTLHLDNFKVEKTPTCYTPEVTVDSVGATEVKLTIIPHFPTDTKWDVMAISDEVNRDTVFTTVTETHCIVSGFKHSTTYSLYVRTNCGEGDVSEWTETPATFNMLFKVGDGTFYGFEESEGLAQVPGLDGYTHPSLYIYGPVSRYSPNQLKDAKLACTGERVMHIQTYNQYGLNTGFALPEIMGADTLQIRFDMRATNAEVNANIEDKNQWTFAPLEIGTVNTDYDLASFQPIASYHASMYEPNNMKVCDVVRDNNNRMYDEVVIPLPEDMTDKFLVFISRTAAANNLYVDNLRFEKKQGYQTPIIGRSTITPTSLTLNWEANGATAWNVYLLSSPLAFPLDSANAADIVAQQLNVTATTVTFTGLQPDTHYYAFLQVANAEGLGATSARRIYRTPVESKIATDSVLTFEGTVGVELQKRYPNLTTGDSIYAVPFGWYVGNAASSTRPSLPWARLNNYNATSTAVSAGVTVAMQGQRALQLNTQSNSTTIGAYAAMPELDADYDTLQVNFYARPFYAKADGTISSAQNLTTPLLVGTMTDPNNPATFEVLDTLYYANTSLTSETDLSRLENHGFQQFGFRLRGAKGKYVAFAAPKQTQWYIDNISFGAYTCLTPNAIRVSDVTAHTALLTWKPKDAGASCILQVATDVAFSEKDLVLVDTLTVTSHVLEHLSGITTYYCRVRQMCSDSELSDWSPVTDFFTECADIDDTYFDSFEDESNHIYLPGATTSSYIQNRCWTVGTTSVSTSKYYYLPSIKASTSTSSTAHNSTNELLGKYSWEIKGYWTTNEVTSSNAINYYDEWMTMPAWNDTIATDSLQLTFYALAGVYNPTTERITRSYTISTYLPSVIVGVMSDPNDLSTFVPLDTCTYSESISTSTVANAGNDYMFQRFSVSLKDLLKYGRYIAFRTYTKDYLATHPEYNASTTLTTTLYIDDVTIESLNECQAPTNLAASDITLSSASLSWQGEEGAKWILNVSTDKTFEKPEAAIIDNDTLTTMEAVVKGLDIYTTYYWTVRQLCSATSKSPVSAVASFHTLRVPAYTEFFIEKTAEDWLTASAKLEDVVAGAELQTTLSSSYWEQIVNENNYGMSGPHMSTRMNSSYGETGSQVRRNNWLLSPAIVLNDTQDAWLTFNAALTYFGKGDAPDQTGWDDQFMVIISEDGGKTWSRNNATVWNNEISTDPENEYYVYGKGDYVLNQLPTFATTADPIFIDLSQYKGKTIKVAFYTESTVKNAYNQLHLGNVHINYYIQQEEAQTACQFEDMKSLNGMFSIDGDFVQAGENIFTKVAFADDTNMVDTLYRFVATYEEAPQVPIDVTICEGESAGALWGFTDRNKSGVYKRKGVSAITGCDSITVFNLTVLPRQYSEEEVTICSGTSYEFNGNTYAKTGVYVDTLKANVTGCDSIVKLILTVSPAITYEYDAYTCEGVPYYFTPKYPALIHSGKYMDSLKTAEGCDSIVTLHLTVSEIISVPVYQTICEGTSFTFEGEEYTKAGEYPVHLQSVYGCDSIRTLYLTVAPTYRDTIRASICPGKSYTENGFNESKAGFYILAKETALGCDSIICLDLSFYNTDTMRVDTTIRQNQLPYFYPNTSITYPLATEAGVYRDTVTVTGTGEQCEYILIHTLTILDDTGIGNVGYSVVKLVPNLIHVGESVDAIGDFGNQILTLEVYDMVGRRVLHRQVHGTDIRINCFDVAGLYTVRLTDQQGTDFVGRVVVK